MANKHGQPDKLLHCGALLRRLPFRHLRGNVPLARSQVAPTLAIGHKAGTRELQAQKYQVYARGWTTQLGSVHREFAVGQDFAL